MVSIFKGTGDTKNSSCHGVVKLLAHGMKVVERVLEKTLCRIVSVDEMQIDLMPERGPIDAVFILERMQ